MEPPGDPWSASDIHLHYSRGRAVVHLLLSFIPLVLGLAILAKAELSWMTAVGVLFCGVALLGLVDNGLKRSRRAPRIMLRQDGQPGRPMR